MANVYVGIWSLIPRSVRDIFLEIFRKDLVDIYLEIFYRDVFIRLYLHKSLEAIFSKLKSYIYPSGRALKMYFSSFSKGAH